MENSEVKKEVESSQTPTTTPTSESNLSIIERAEKLNKETLEAEKRISEHRARIEEIETRRVLGGNTFAGRISKTPEEIKLEEAEKLGNEIANAFRKK